jgi:hypothetical protein
MKNNLSLIGLLLAVIFALSCKKSNGTAPAPTPPQVPVDPAVANTIGFFLNDWNAKTFTVPSYSDTVLASGSASVTVTINPSSIITKIPESIYGNNSNVYMTQMVTAPSLLGYITNLNPHIIRFPGGSLSDTYFWNADVNTPPADAPAQLPDANGNNAAAGYWYGKNTASWTMSLDNYYQMLQQTGSQGIITINYGYARYGMGTNPVATAAHLAADWVRYDNGRTKYWEIGNEDYGDWEAGYRIDQTANKDGQPQIITGALYGEHFTIFADSMRNAAQEIGKTIYISAVLLETQPGSSSTPVQIQWDNGVMASAGNSPDFYSVHNYFTPYQENSTVTTILNSASINTASIMSWMKTVTGTSGYTQKPIAFTEWNINAEGSMQEVSYINGMHATLVLGEMLTNKFGLACRWDLANGWDNGNDQGMFNTGDEPGNVPLWNPRPPFYYMYYFRKMAGDRLVSATVSGNYSIAAYATSFSSGQVGAALVNMGTTSQTVSLNFQNFTPGNRYYWYRLTGGTDNGDFSREVYINGKGPDAVSGGPSNYASLNAYSSLTSKGIKFNMPARSVIYVVIDKSN